jgi:hypothetical protein
METTVGLILVYLIVQTQNFWRGSEEPLGKPR